MTRSLEELDQITHDPGQTHLREYADDARGPYPGHPHGAD